MVDGISLNNLSDNFADVGAFPVGEIDRIEIIKGPASSVWGSSLGGVINIITRSPDPEPEFRRLGFGVRSAAGHRRFPCGHFRHGRQLGYYLYGGGFTSDGLTPATSYDGGNFYGKLQWAASGTAHLQFSLAYDKGARKADAVRAVLIEQKDRSEYFRSTARANLCAHR